jgi:guanylate kinase
MQQQNKVIIITAPSGSGKTTLVRHLLSHFPQLEFSVSACTRAPRPNEQHGKDYYFISTEEFKRRITAGDFVEYEEVYPGMYYGTLKSELARIWAKQHVVLFDVDVRGALHLKQIFADNAYSVFIKAPGMDILEARLRARATETEEKIQVRLAKVREELQMENRFDAVIVNDSLDLSKEEIELIVKSFIYKN